MKGIHPTAVIEEGAEMASDVQIGPYSVIGGNVKIAKGCRLYSHVTMSGDLTVGENNQFFPFTSIGQDPQDFSFKNEDTRVEIGKANVFRECVTVHKGTLKDDELTSIGDNNLIMAYAHVAHDVKLGSHCTVANLVQLAGHVKIADRVILGGGVLVIPFISIATGSYICAGTTVDRNIPPFSMAEGERVKIKGINIIALRRQGHDRKSVMKIVGFYKTIAASDLSPKAFVGREDLVQDFQGNAIVGDIMEFIKTSTIGIAPLVS